MTTDDLSIEAVLDYYSDEVVDALAAAVVTADQFPEEALNELRASYTHLARAHKHSDDHKTKRKELNSAHRHLKRVCVDALKISVMATAQRADNAIDALTEDLQLPNEVYLKVSNLRTRRKAISIHESRETTLGVIDEMKALFNDYDEFLQSLDDQFAGATASERQKIRKRRSRRINMTWAVVGFLLGIVGSLIASVIYDNWPSVQVEENSTQQEEGGQ